MLDFEPGVNRNPILTSLHRLFVLRAIHTEHDNYNCSLRSHQFKGPLVIVIVLSVNGPL